VIKKKKKLLFGIFQMTSKCLVDGMAGKLDLPH